MSLIITVIPSNQLGSEDRKQVIALCSEVFELDYGPFIEAFGEVTHVLGYRANEIACHALWLQRELRVGDGRTLNAAYIEAVATRPKYQRQGYGSALMRHLQKDISESGLGALSTSRDEWYEGLGWKCWLGPKYIQKGREVIATPEDCVMVYGLPGKPLPDLTASLTADWRPLELW
jgi:GNAT superfamily N-acetyltransferase